MATRFYFNAGAPAVTPAAWGGTWHYKAAVPETHKLEKAPSDEYIDVSITNDATATARFGACFRCVSEPLAAQSLSGTVKGQIYAYENNAANNATLAVAIIVINSSGTKVATLLNVSASDDTSATPPEFVVSSVQDVTNRSFKDASERTSISHGTYSCADGDRLVVEVGVREVRALGSEYLYTGDETASGDLPEDETTLYWDGEVSHRAWVEFSANIAFLPNIAGTANGAATVSGTATGAGAVSGSAAGTTTISGTATGAGTVAGTAAGISGASGTLKGDAILSGCGGIAAGDASEDNLRVRNTNLPIRDDFNRLTLGSEWTTIYGSPTAEGSFRSTGGFGAASAQYIGTSISDNQYVEATFSLYNWDDTCDLRVRYRLDKGKYYSYIFRVTEIGEADGLYVLNSNVETLLATGGDGFIENGSVCRLEVAGSKVRVYVNDVLRYSVTNTLLTTGRPALAVYDGGTWDDFKADTLNQVVSGAGAVSSAQVVSSPRCVQVVEPTSVASAATIGSVRLKLFVLPTGVGSASVFGSAWVGETGASIQPTGIVSVAAIPNPSVHHAAGGIGSAEVVPSPRVQYRVVTVEIAGETPGDPPWIPEPSITVGPTFIVPTGIVSGEAFGGTDLDQDVEPTAIGSAVALGVPTVVPGAVIISPSSIAPGGCGTPRMTWQQFLGATAIESAEVVSAPTVGVEQYVVVTGIVSSEAHGFHNMAPVQFVSATGIVAGYAAGATHVVHQIKPASLPVGWVVDSPTVLPGVVVVLPSSISSTVALGEPICLVHQRFSPTAIGPGEAWGEPNVVAEITPAEVTVGEVFGEPTIIVGETTVVCPGIATLESVGEPALFCLLAPTAIDSAEVTPSPTVVPGTRFCPVSSIGSAEAFGAHNVAREQFIAVTGLVSGSLFGTTRLGPLRPAGVASAEVVSEPDVTISTPVPLTGIPTAEALGEPVIVCTIHPVGVGAGACGSPLIIPGPVSVIPPSVETEEVIGDPVVMLQQFVSPSAIDSAEASGSPSVVYEITPNEVWVTGAVGEPTIRSLVTLQPTGISTVEGLGVAWILFRIRPTGIGSAETVGDLNLAREGFVFPSSIDSAAAFGITRLGPLRPAGVSSAEAFGSTVIGIEQYVGPSGAASTEAVGQPTVGVEQYLGPGGVASGEAVGALTVIPQQFVEPTSIDSGETAGGPAFGWGLHPTALTSAEACGEPIVVPGGVEVAPDSVVSAEAIGAPRVVLVVAPSSPTPSEDFGGATLVTGGVSIWTPSIFLSWPPPCGQPTILVGPVYIQPDGLSESAVSEPTLILWLLANGIVTAEALGDSTILPGTVTLDLPGIVSGEAVGDPVCIPEQFVEPSGVAAGACGQPTVMVEQFVEPTAIGSGETAGDPAVVQSVSPTGIVAGICGSPTILPGEVSVAPTAIASVEGVGEPVVMPEQFVGASAIGTEEAIPEPTVVWEQFVDPDAIDSLGALGTLTLTLWILPPSIGPGAFGALTVARGAVSVGPTGIVSLEAVGSAHVVQLIQPGGMAAGAVGALTVVPGAVSVEPTAIGSGEALSSPTLRLYLQPPSIVSLGAVGEPELDQITSFPGVASAEVFGVATIGRGPVSVAPSSILTGVAFGPVVVWPSHLVQDESILSAEACGTPVVVPGSVTVLVESVPSPPAVPAPHVLSWIAPESIDPSEAFGTTHVGRCLNPTGISSVEAVGQPTFYFHLIYVMGAGGIGSQESVGEFGFVEIYVRKGDGYRDPLYVTDDFNRAGPGLGSDWYVYSGTPHIEDGGEDFGGIVQGSTRNTPNLAVWQTGTFVRDQYCQMDTSLFAPVDEAAVMVRWAVVSKGFRCIQYVINSGSSQSIILTNGNASTILASAPYLGAGGTMRLVAVYNRVWAYLNGELQFDITIPYPDFLSFVNPGQPAISIRCGPNAPLGFLDNFLATEQGLPIFPVGIKGAAEADPVYGGFGWPHRTHVTRGQQHPGPVAIPTVEAFGQPTITTHRVVPIQSVPSAEAFGLTLVHGGFPLSIHDVYEDEFSIVRTTTAVCALIRVVAGVVSVRRTVTENLCIVRREEAVLSVVRVAQEVFEL